MGIGTIGWYGCLLVALAGQDANQVVEARLPPELEAIVRANSESLRRLRSAIATIKVSTLHDYFGKGTVSYTERYTVHVKGRKVREDFSAVDPNEQRRLTVELNGGRGTLVMGPPDARRRVATSEFVMSYVPGQGFMVKSAGDPAGLYGERASVLHRYVAVGALGRTLEERVRQNAAKGYLPSISDDTVDGVPCKLLAWDYPGSDMAAKIWIVPSQGHMVTRYRAFHKGQMASEWSMKIKDYGDGVFWVSAAETKMWGRGSLLDHVLLTVEKMEANVPVEDSVFTVEGLDLPPDVLILDKILGLRYRYGAPFALPQDHVQAVLGDAEGTAAETPTTEAATAPSEAGQSTPTTESPVAPSQPEASAGMAATTWVPLVALLILGAVIGVILAIRRRRVNSM